MTYITSATERTTGSGNTNETRALFYLMGQDEDRDEIDWYVVDVFNDLTGSNATANRLWDIQSKNARSGPKMVGEELVTLFKNYMSDFNQHFVRRILFLGSVTNAVRSDDAMLHFRYEDVKETSKGVLKEGLRLELLTKTYIDDSWVTDENIDEFLNTVEFVIADEDKASYVRPLVGAVSNDMVDDKKLEAIFNEVRKVQADKKNIPSEGIEMNHPHEVFRIGKVLGKQQIEQLILARLINRDPISGGIPQSFVSVYNDFPPEAAEEMLETCQHSLALQLFEKNAKDAFWSLFNRITEIVASDRALDVQDIYNRIDESLLEGCVHLNPLSTMLFIAQIKDGLK